jgi:hypothetical protein
VYSDYQMMYSDDQDTFLIKGNSLLRWFRRHGVAVRSIDFNLCDLDEANSFQKAEFLCLVDSWLALCSVGLEKLTLALNYYDNATVGGWAVSMPCLQELTIIAKTLHTWVSLSGLSALKCLKIDVEKWHMGTAVELPSSITRLCIERHQADQMPSQVGVWPWPLPTPAICSRTVRLWNGRSVHVVDRALNHLLALYACRWPP